MMKSAEIRETFLKFFENYHHQRVKSSSLVPAGDATLLFTNAGMVQFKDCFLGLSDPGYRRATTCQKCVRAGGKHNDLENVGFTARHHTFFEMLGNFSFGDYFKKEAITFAWELLTRHYKIPKERLQVTVFKDDDEAFELWKAQGVRADWITRLGEKDNFWAMGDTGPCGPCSEIYYDWGKEYGCKRPTCNPGCECGTRFLEIWNLVFMQFNRDSSGKLTPLPKPSVDTGAGLERLSSVLQGVYSNYDTDLFTPLLQAIAERTGKKYGANPNDDVSMRVIADHLRSGTFLLSDGVTPSNEGRGYVLRRILRRAIRHGKKLGQEEPFIYHFVEKMIETLAAVYPEIQKNKKMIEVVIREEEQRFHETLHRGMGLLEESIQKVKKNHQKVLPGDIAFKLYDTFGFPLDLIEVIAKEQDLEVDQKNFDTLMQQQRAKSVWNRGDDAGVLENISKSLEAKKWESNFVGYETLKSSGKALILSSKEGKAVSVLNQQEEGFVVFDKTPFYAESGGQVGDRGTLVGHGAKAVVQGTFKVSKTILHRIFVEEGRLKVDESYELEVNSQSRCLTAINHTATHLLHAALRSALGDRVKQAGSLVEPERLRFDFTFPRPMTFEEIEKAENWINETVRYDANVNVEEMAFDEAIKRGALAFFDEKYGSQVRVVRVGPAEKPFSVELCGGTHLSRTSEIGFFKILSESSVASGIRRIEAITSTTALDYLLGRNQLLGILEKKLGTQNEAVVQKIEQLVQQVKTIAKENEQLKLKVVQGGNQGGQQELFKNVREINGIKVITDTIPSVGPKLLRTLVDQARDKFKERAIVVLGSELEGKVSLCVGVTKDLVDRYKASEIIQPLAKEVGGTGGGRADFAQAGGNNPAGLAKAFELLTGVIKEIV